MKERCPPAMGLTGLEVTRCTFKKADLSHYARRKTSLARAKFKSNE